MWNISFPCTLPNQKWCVAKTNPGSWIWCLWQWKMYLELIVFDSVLNIFRVLNTNHKLNDLTSKATTFKAFIPLAFLTLHPGLQAALLNQRVSILTHEHTQATAVAARERCPQTPPGERMDCRRADSDLCLKWHFTQSLQNVFKTTKAFYVISLNVYFIRIQICNKTICIKIKLLWICC